MNINRSFKGWLLLVFVSLFCSQLTALDWGMTCGLNSANFIVSDKSIQGNHRPHSEYIFGIYMTFHISDFLNVQPEIHFTHIGSDYTWDPYGIDKYHFKFKMPYFQIPLLLKLNLPEKGTISPCLFMGPYIGIKQKATFSRVIDHGSEEEFGQREDITDNINKIDFGLIFGAGIDVKVCFGKISVDLRYNNGLTNITEDFEALAGLMTEESIAINEYAAGKYSLMDSIKNKSFIIMFGIGF